jgi:hypothetical protein
MSDNRGSDFVSNNATYAGGLGCSDNSTAELHAEAFVANYVDNNGAGLVVAGTAQVRLLSSSVSRSLNVNRYLLSC